MYEEIKLQIVFNLDEKPFHLTTAFHLNNADITGARHSNGHKQEHIISLLTTPANNKKKLVTIAVAVDMPYQGFKTCKQVLIDEKRGDHHFLVLEIYN